MFFGDWPDLRDTQSGKDLIEIGKIEGGQEALVVVWETRFGRLPPETRQRIAQVQSVEKLRDLLSQVVRANAPEQIQW
jgi:hypothetical protein